MSKDLIVNAVAGMRGKFTSADIVAATGVNKGTATKTLNTLSYVTEIRKGVYRAKGRATPNVGAIKV